MEIWKDIPNWEGLYQASDKGRIRSLDRVKNCKNAKGKILNPISRYNREGYLAAKIQSEISRVTKNSLRSANVNNVDDVEEFFAQATKEVVNSLPLNGVMRDKIYQGKDGSLYIHVILKPDAYEAFLEQTEKALKSRIKKNIARENINETEKATKAIFDELEKERK